MENRSLLYCLFISVQLVLAACTDTDRKPQPQAVDGKAPVPPPMTTDLVTLDVEMDGMFALTEENGAVLAFMPRLDQKLKDESGYERDDQDTEVPAREIPNTARWLPQHYGFIKLDAKNLAPGNKCWGDEEEGVGSAPVFLSLSAEDARKSDSKLSEARGHEIEFEGPFNEAEGATIFDDKKEFVDIRILDKDRAKIAPKLKGELSGVPADKLVGRTLFKKGMVVPREPRDGSWIFAYYSDPIKMYGSHAGTEVLEVVEVKGIEKMVRLASKAGIVLTYPRGPIKLHLRPFGGGNPQQPFILCPAPKEKEVKVVIANLPAEDIIRRTGDAHKLTENRVEHFLAYYSLSEMSGIRNKRFFPLRMTPIGLGPEGGGDPYCSLARMAP